MSTIPDDLNALLLRIALAEALTRAGFPIKAKTLATMATRGGGPPYRLFGQRALERAGLAADGVAVGVDPIDVIDRYYKQAMATGGYFRDPYNIYSLISALGLSWAEDVGPLLNEWGELPITGARHFLAELERRP